MNNNQLKHLGKAFLEQLNSESQCSEVRGNFFVFNGERIPLVTTYVNIELPYSLLVSENLQEVVYLLDAAQKKIKHSLNIRDSEWVGKFYISDVKNAISSSLIYIILSFHGASLSKIVHSEEFKKVFDELINE